MITNPSISNPSPPTPPTPPTPQTNPRYSEISNYDINYTNDNDSSRQSSVSQT